MVDRLQDVIDVVRVLRELASQDRLRLARHAVNEMADDKVTPVHAAEQARDSFIAPASTGRGKDWPEFLVEVLAGFGDFGKSQGAAWECRDRDNA